MRWYVLYVATGKEKQVAEELTNQGIHALVPCESRIIHSKGVWSEKEYILFPSYVFLEADFNASVWYKVNNIDHVIRWLGDKKEPSYLAYLEAEWIRLLGNEGKLLKPSLVEIKDDGSYIVKSGILAMFKSKILSLNKRQKTVKVSLPISEETKDITLSIEIETGSQDGIDSSSYEDPVDIETLSDVSAI